MSLVVVEKTNFILLTVGSCVKMEWSYQEEHAGDEYVTLYKVRGMPQMMKESDTIYSLAELVLRPSEAEEVEVIIDKEVHLGDIVLVQEVLQHKNRSVGTVLNTKPVRQGDSGALYTGIMMDNSESGTSQVYVIDVGAKEFELWLVEDGVRLMQDDHNPKGNTNDLVPLGGVFRFLADDKDLGVVVEDVVRSVSSIEVINKYK